MAVLKLIVFLCMFVTVHLETVIENNAVAEVEAYIENKKSEMNTRYRLRYHVSPPVGWMNDPNGFSFYKGNYHLFYQFYPYDSQWDPMHWGHVKSPNLVDWVYLPTALVPEDEMCFSGSAIVKDDSLVLIYTGRKDSDMDPFFNESQYLAFSDDGIHFNKYEGNPVILNDPNGSADFRDPKIWEHDDHWYVIIGSKTLDDEPRGRVLLYRSPDMITWEFLSVLAESSGDLGYMWECPDFFEMNGKYVLLWSPQGVAPAGDRYNNLYQTGYIIGNFNYETFEFVPLVGFQEIDFGHDFYASQTVENDGKRILIAWFGMWETGFPEAVDGWAGALTIPRELKLRGNRLLMQPVDAMITLRGKLIWNGELEENEEIVFEKTAEIILGNRDISQKIELEITGTNGGQKVVIRWEPDTRKVIVDRSGDVRQMEWLPIGTQSWRIFVDTSSIELFCGEGEVVFSTRIYPEGDWVVKNSSPRSLDVLVYRLRRSVPEP